MGSGKLGICEVIEAFILDTYCNYPYARLCWKNMLFLKG